MDYIWKSGDNWPKVAYKQYGDETRYRDIVSANPGLSPYDLPRPGQKITVPDLGTESVFGVQTTNDTPDQFYFPWINPKDYYDRLLQYNGIALWFVKDINGPALNAEG